jgi:hypothetical protein
MGANSFNVSHNLTIGNYTWNCYSCDTVSPSNCGFASNNRTVEMRPLSEAVTCTCPSSSRWGIDLSDNCEITEDCDVRPYETYCYGTAGGLGIYANLYTRNFTCNFDNVIMNKSGVVWIEKN